MTKALDFPIDEAEPAKGIKVTSGDDTSITRFIETLRNAKHKLEILGYIQALSPAHKMIAESNQSFQCAEEIQAYINQITKDW